MRNPELIWYPFKVAAASHPLGMLKYFTFCDSARQELTGHLTGLRGQNTRSAILCKWNLHSKSSHRTNWVIIILRCASTAKHKLLIKKYIGVLNFMNPNCLKCYKKLNVCNNFIIQANPMILKSHNDPLAIVDKTWKQRRLAVTFCKCGTDSRPTTQGMDELHYIQPAKFKATNNI